jgi:alpha-N-acetylglucosaminidase
MKHLLFTFLASACIFTARATPADDLLNRIGGAGTSARIITQVVTPASGGDTFTITSENGKPKISGNSYLSVATGIHWYLKYHAGVMLSWNCLSADLSGVTFPVPAAAETHSTNLQYRYYLNYCTYSYSMPFWDWKRWEQEIDWMALHGINMPLAIVGTDVVWKNVLTKYLGYTPAEANQFVAGAAYQAWFLMNNLEGWGGPNPDSYYTRMEDLQKKILARMRELGMEPVLPGCSAIVPSNIKSKKSSWNVTAGGIWCGFTRPSFLNPTTAEFREMAGYYYKELRELYGTSKYYSIDPFHETSAIPVSLTVAYPPIYQVLKDSCGYAGAPQWVIQQWQWDSNKKSAANVLKPGELIILDLFSDGRPGTWWKNANGYQISGSSYHDWVYCVLNDFGGRTGLQGRIQRTIDDYYEAKSAYPQSLKGVGTTMEAIEMNAVAYEVLYELPWRETKKEATAWIRDYAKARYGLAELQAGSELSDAWSLLQGSVYNNAVNSQQGPDESLLCARPSLTATKASVWGPSGISHDSLKIRQAAALMLIASEQVASAQTAVGQENLAYDIVDVTRQALADYARVLLPQINAAQSAGDTALRNALADQFLELICSQDTLLNTEPNFMLGKWIASARAMGTTIAEKNLYENNARLLISTWGDQSRVGGDHDYSYREWGGMLGDLYYTRWKTFFDKLKASQTLPSSDDFFTIEWSWANTATDEASPKHPVTPQGDPVATARRMFAKFFPDALPEDVGATRTVKVRTANADWGVVSIDGSDADSIVNHYAVAVRAKAYAGYRFEKWTKDDTILVSWRTAYTYTRTKDVTLTAHFVSLDYDQVWTMPAGSDTAVQPLTFNPALSTRAKWQLDVTMQMNGDFSNEWGSPLLAGQSNPFAISVFQYYLGTATNGNGKFVLNNATTYCNITTFPADFYFKLTCAGDGQITITPSVNKVEYGQHTLTQDSLSLLTKSTCYTAKVGLFWLKELPEDPALPEDPTLPEDDPALSVSPLPELSDKSGLSVFPNPVNGTLSIRKAGNSTVSLYTLTGTLLLQTKENQIDMSMYAVGSYLLQCGDKVVKIIKN